MTALLSSLFPIGNITAFLWPFVFINEKERNPSILKKEIQRYFISTLIPIILTFILIIIFFENNHERDRFLKIEDEKTGKNKYGFWHQIKTLGSDYCYLGMLFSSGLSSAGLAVVGDTFNTVIAPFGFSLVSFKVLRSNIFL